MLMTIRRSGVALLLAMAVLPACGREDGNAGGIDLSEILKPPPVDPTLPIGTRRYSLSDAQSQGIVESKVIGQDASSGECLVLGIRRLTDQPVDVFIAPGTVLSPRKASVQRMVAWGVVGAVKVSGDAPQPVTSMYLDTKAPRLFVVEAYCLDFALENPSTTDVLRPQPEPHVRGAQIIRAGKGAGLSIGTIQTAIWIDEDHVTKQEIQAKFEASDKEVEDAFELLKRTPQPKRK